MIYIMIDIMGMDSIDHIETYGWLWMIHIGGLTKTQIDLMGFTMICTIY